MNIELFDYALPENLIAQKPADKRGMDRLLVANGPNGLEHKLFPDIINYFKNGDLLVLNDTKVIPCRIFGEKKESHGKVELLFTEPADGFSVEEALLWQCVYRSGKPLRPGQIISHKAAEIEVTENQGGGLALVKRVDGAPIFPLLMKCGAMPLPPYINRAAEEDDKTRYQTVYAQNVGAVAAPTAGLHFTDELLAAIEKRGVTIKKLTLHVGLGTFWPIREEAFSDITRHKMHEERYHIGQDLAEAVATCHAAGGRVFATGTTCVRALESAATAPYELKSGSGRTAIFIYPGFEFKIVDALITNFHLPKSTLIILVSAFAGRECVLSTYKEAVKEGYHFFSYGDSSLFFRAK